MKKLIKLLKNDYLFLSTREIKLIILKYKQALTYEKYEIEKSIENLIEANKQAFAKNIKELGDEKDISLGDLYYLFPDKVEKTIDKLKSIDKEYKARLEKIKEKSKSLEGQYFQATKKYLEKLREKEEVEKRNMEIELEKMIKNFKL